jgi:DNA-binding transcriptional LysR family regulator
VAEPKWLLDMQLFIAVARAKSFTRAAAAVQISTSSLSRRVAELEHSLGLRLLNRTTRHVEITEDGRLYLAHAERLVEHARLMHEDLRDRVRKPSGTLRVSLPEAIATQLAIPWFSEFCRTYPDISIEVHTAPDHVDQLADNIDICIYDREVPNSSLFVRRLATFRRGLCASPHYIASNGMPNHPRELGIHKCIGAGNDDLARKRWTLTRGTETFVADISGTITATSLVLAPDLAKAGLGIANIMLPYFAEDTRMQRLVPVLPEWIPEPVPILAIYPSRNLPTRSRVFLDFFAEKMERHMASFPN